VSRLQIHGDPMGMAYVYSPMTLVDTEAQRGEIVVRGKYVMRYHGVSCCREFSLAMKRPNRHWLEVWATGDKYWFDGSDAAVKFLRWLAQGYGRTIYSEAV
jgi:hypothetical protein